MISPTPDQMKALAYIEANMPVFTEWLAEMARVELDRLPYTAATNMAVSQGRCQVLQELVKVISEAPNTVAKSR